MAKDIAVPHAGASYDHDTGIDTTWTYQTRLHSANSFDLCFILRAQKQGFRDIPLTADWLEHGVSGRHDGLFAFERDLGEAFM